MLCNEFRSDLDLDLDQNNEKIQATNGREMNAILTGTAFIHRYALKSHHSVHIFVFY